METKTMISADNNMIRRCIRWSLFIF